MEKVLKVALCAALTLYLVPSVAASPISEDDKAVADSTIMMSNKFTKNWELSVMLGAQSYLAEFSQFSTGNFKLKDSWRFTGDISLVKWASPYFGLGFGFTEAGFKGIYRPGTDTRATFAKQGDPVYPGYNGWFSVATGSYGNLFAKATVNFSNLFGGFDSRRRFEVTGYAGGGIIFPTCKIEKYKRAKGATFNAGINAQYRIAKHLYVTAALRGALISDGFNGISYVTGAETDNLSLDGQAGALVGISYKFGYNKRKNQKSGVVNEYEWIPSVVAFETSETVKAMVDKEVAAVEEVKDAQIAAVSEKLDNESHELEQLRAENERLTKLLEETQSIVASNVSYWQYVSFHIDRTVITNRQKVNVMAAADFIKSHPELKFVINGYADKQTATPEHNVMLGDGRAKAVFNALVNEFGVNPDQLEFRGNGGVDYMYFKDKECSRCVLITVKK